METAGIVLVGLGIAIGLAGIIIPILPGLLLIWGSVTVWALFERTTTAWVVLGVATALYAVSQVLQFLIPGRRLRNAGVPTRGILIGMAFGIVGFFVIPVVGLFLGFVGGIYLVEWTRMRNHQAAWRSTVHALKAVGIAILIELCTGLLIATGWLVTVIFG